MSSAQYRHARRRDDRTLTWRSALAAVVALVLGVGTVVGTGAPAEAARIASVAVASGTTYTQQFTQSNAANATATYTVSGNTVQAPTGAAGGPVGSHPDKGVTAAMLSEVIPTGTSTAQIHTNSTGCVFTVGQTTTCQNRGTVTVSFSQPVTNPVVHLSGLGATIGGNNQGVATTFAAQGTLTSTPAGASMTVLTGTNLAVSSNTFQTTGNRPNTACNVASNAQTGATSSAGCGSVQVTGQNLTQLSFAMSLRGNNNGTSIPEAGAGADQFNMLVTLQDQPLPTANPDTATTPELAPVTTDVQSNDTAGAGSIDRAAIRLSQPAGGTISGDGRTATLPSVGTWAVNAGHNVVFTPVSGFRGATPALGYTVTDTAGSTASSTLTVTVTPSPPRPQPDTPTTPQGQAVTFTPLTNDQGSASPTNAALDPTSVFLIDGSGNAVRNLTVANQGAYTVNTTTGAVTFTPVPAFTGQGSAVTYRVATTTGTTATSTITPTVTPVPPRAVPDSATTQQNTAVTLTPAANDRPGIDSGSAVVASSVQLQQPGGGFATELTNTQGRYVVNTSTGVVTFTPASGFTGTTTPVTYRVADTAGATATSTITVTVTGVSPTAVPDTARTPQGQAVTTDVVANDQPGNAGTPLNRTSVALLAVDGNTPTNNNRTLTIPGLGTYTVDATSGDIRFAPLASFRGTATAVPYRVADINGTTTQSTLTVTVTPAPPIAVDDVRSTQQNTSVTLHPADNDTPGNTGGSPVDRASVRLVGSGGALVTTLSTGAGVFTVNTTAGANAGQVTFVPSSGFTGTVPAVTYSIADTGTGTPRSTAEIRITVTGVAPTAVADTATTAQGSAVSRNLLTNDSPGNTNTPLAPARTVWVAAAGQTLSQDGRTLTVPNQGVYVLNADGVATFTPAAAYRGSATPVTYRVYDIDNGTATSTFAVTVTPVGPVAVDDTASTTQNTPVTFAPAANDGPGVTGGTPIDPATLRLVSGTQLVDTLSVNGSGTFTVVTSGAQAGQVTFTPAQGFTGTVPEVTYSIADTGGQQARAQIRVTVTTVAPIARNDTATTTQGQAVSGIPLLDNDSPGNAATPLAPARTVWVATADQTISGDGRRLTVPGEGVYVLDAEGRASFTPVGALRGTATPVTYRAVDVDGGSAMATLTVTVTPVGPVAVDDEATTAQRTPVTISPDANDRPGVTGGTPINPQSVRLLVGEQLLETRTIAGTGTFVVNTETGQVTFTPAPGFRGTTPDVAYSVADTGGQRATAQIRVTVTAVSLTANPDTATTPQGSPVTVPVLANDTPGNAQVGLNPASVVLLAVGADQPSADGKALTVSGQGAYAVDGQGRVTFTPAAAFRGTATPVPYRVADVDGTTAESTLTVTVTAVGPVAVDDDGTTAQNVPVVVPVLANDRPGITGGTPLDPASVRLVGPGGGLVPSLELASGTFTVTDDGEIRFAPAGRFSGTVPPVTYSVADTGGERADAVLRLTVTAVAPVANPDTATTAQGQSVSVPVLGNDTAGNAQTPLDPTSVVLLPLNGNQPTQEGKFLRIPGEGAYSVDPQTGAIAFAPVPTFRGAATPVTYRVADVDGTTAQSTLTVTATPVGPVAVDDTASTGQNTPVTIFPSANDRPGVTGGQAVDPTTVRLLDDAGDPVTSLTTPAGTFTVTTANGAVTFTPDPGVTGPVPPVPYRVADAGGQTATATITVTVTAVAPLAVDDTATTPEGVAKPVDVLANDVAGNAATPLDRTSVALVALDGADLADDGRTLAVPGEGVYTVDPETGVITFTPTAPFRGTATPVTYEVADSNGTTDTATLTMTVTAVRPVAVEDELTTQQNTPVTFNPAANDRPAVEGGTPIDPTSVLFVEDGELVERVERPSGVFTVNTETGFVTFTPAPGFTGQVVPPFVYSVADTDGVRSQGRITLAVLGVEPIAIDDLARTPQGQQVEIPVLANDVQGNAGTPLQPGSVVLLPLDGAELGDDGKSLVVPDQGTYTVAPDGVVTFAPLPAFRGEATPVRYQVSDADTTTATALITVTVTPVGPVAVDDEATTQQNTPVTFSPAANDEPGVENGTPVDPTTLRLLDGEDLVTERALPGVGTFTVLPDGQVRFDPAQGFRGQTPAVGYSVADEVGLTATAALHVTVTPVSPTADDDADTTVQGRSVTIDVVENDTAGNARTPLDRASVQLLPVGGVSPTDGGRSLRVSGQGLWTVDAVTGDVTFAPIARFRGDATPITYLVRDVDGTSASAQVRVSVSAVAPVAVDDDASTEQNTPVRIDVLENDTPGIIGGTPLDPESVRLLDGADLVTERVLEGAGTFTLDGPVVVFTPVQGFTGPVPPVRYSVADLDDVRSDAAVTVTVTAVSPTANDDVEETPQGGPVTIDVLANDEPGNGSTELDRTSVVLLAQGENDPSEDGRTLVVPGEGTWTVDPTTGAITFTPLALFRGETTPVTYRVFDEDRGTDTADVTVTVAPLAPDAVDDVASTQQNTPVEIAVAANDNPGVSGGTPLVPSSVRFVVGDELQESVSNDGGRFVVDTSTGVVTFTPAPGFTGAVPPVTYSIADTGDERSTAEIRVTVTAVAPTANDDADTTTQGVPVTVPVLLNDVAGNALTPLQPASVVLVALDDVDPSEDGKTLQVPGQGTWTVVTEGEREGDITFTPLATFRGQATPVTYQVSDADGSSARAFVTVTITPVGPVAVDDDEQTDQNTPVTFAPAANDRAGVEGGTGIDASSVRLLDGAQLVTELTTDAGTYVVDTGTGRVTFTPAARFTGPTPPVTYSVADEGGLRTTALIRIAVTGVEPVALADSGTTAQSSPVTIDVLANDVAGNAGTPLAPSSVVLLAQDGAELSEDGKTLRVPGEGTWTVVTEGDDEGEITFTPLPSFRGDASPVIYRVFDTDGSSADATVRVTVTPVAPAPVDDAVTTEQRTPVDIPVLENDGPGVEDGTPLDRTSVQLVSDGQLVPELVLDGVGRFTVTEAGDAITFTPAPGFTGVVLPVTYSVADTGGERSRAQIRVTVSAVTPTATDDVAATTQGEPVRVDVLANDAAGNAATPLDATSVTLLAVGDAQPVEGGRSLTVPEQGTYTVDPETGHISFAPVAAFRGAATPVTYRVLDVDGSPADATLTVTVEAVPPIANDDEATTEQRTPVTLTPAANDEPGIDGGQLVDATSVQLVDGDDLVNELVIPAGRFVVDAQGVVTFTPAPGFTGTARAPYSVADTGGARSTAQLIITVAGVFPVANDDAASTTQGQPVTVTVLANDEAGNDDTPLDPSTVVLLPVNGAAPQDEGKRLTIPGEGVYTVDAEGAITFTPDATHRGTSTPIGYRVLDVDGGVAEAVLSITVAAIGPVTADDTATTGQRTPVSIPVLANDRPGVEDGQQLDLASVLFVNGDGLVDRLELEQGTFTVSTTGVVTFTPAPRFTGEVPPVTYSVADTGGERSTADIAVTVTAVSPLAVDDTGESEQGSAVTVDVVANDVPGNAATPLDRTSVVLLQLGDAEPEDEGRTLRVEGEGVYTVDPETGAVTFAPDATFRGTATAVTYRVADVDGTTGTATLTVTVAPVGPVAVDDLVSTEQNTELRFLPADNDRPGVEGGTAIRPESVRFVVDGELVERVELTDATYVVDTGTGVVTVTPRPGFTGQLPDVEYSVEDIGGERATARIVVAVTGVAPVAVDDEAPATQGTAVEVDVLDNDVPGNAGTPLDRTSVVLLALEGAELDDEGRTLRVTGEGVWRVNPENGRITFTPQPLFRGEATAVTYRVADIDGSTDTATVTVTVAPVPPVTEDDEATTGQNTPVLVDVLGNDVPGVPGGTPLDPASLALVSGDELVTELVLTDVGRFLVVDGQIRFEPARGFRGPVEPVTYSVADTGEQRWTGTLTVTVTGVAPITQDDTGSTTQGDPVTVDVLANDRAGNPLTPLDRGSVALRPLGDIQPGDDGRTLEVPEQGTWTVDETDGRITFTPVPTFRGTATPVTYAVGDIDGGTGTATVTVTVAAVPPAAADDDATTQQNTAGRITVLANDGPGVPEGTALDPESVQLLDGTQLVDELVIAGVGAFTLDGAVVVFTPDQGFTGDVPEVRYSVADIGGVRSSAAITVAVTAVAPTANGDTGETSQGSPVTVDLLANDDEANAGTPLASERTVWVAAPGQQLSDDGRTLTVPGEGVYTLDAEGSATFAPAAALRGTTTPVTYRVVDVDGGSDTATFTVEVAPVPPTAADDDATTQQNLRVEIPVAANDGPGVVGGTPVVPATVRFVVDDQLVESVTTVGGEFTVDTATGVVTFTPAPGFTGPVPTVVYSIADSGEQRSTAEIRVTVTAVGPTANPDTLTVRQGGTGDVNLLLNDVPGNDGTRLAAGGTVWVAAAGQQLSDDGRTLTVTDEGTYVLVDGVATFTPVASFRGEATPVTYRVVDVDGGADTAALSVTVSAVGPIAVRDEPVTEQNTPVTFEPAGNDRPGVVGGTPVVRESVRLVGEGGALVTALSVADGSFTVDTATGAVTFAPSEGFTGPVPPVQYSVADAGGVRTVGTIAVAVTGVAPVAVDDVATTPQGSAVTVDVLANDLPGNTGTPLAPTSLRLLAFDGNEPVDGGRSLTIDGQGTWTVVDGEIAFVPVSGLRGPTTAVPYQVADRDGTTTRAVLTVTVTPVAPRAVPDDVETEQNTPITFNPADNDLRGVEGGTPVDSRSARLVVGGELVDRIEVADGTFAVGPDGAITFTPRAGFGGTVPPVAYSVADTGGARSTGVITVTVAAVQPVAQDDVATTAPESAVVVTVLANDRGGNEATGLVPGSVVLLPIDDDLPTEQGKRLQVTGEGLYVVDSDGVFTFTPAVGFTGVASAVTYRVTDVDGRTAEATLTVTVTGAEPGLRVTKSAELEDANDNGVADPGETVRYSFEVANTGNVTLTDVVVDDPRVTGLDPATIPVLAPGAAVRVAADPYTVSASDVAAGVVANSATVSGQPPTPPGGSAPDRLVSEPSSTAIETIGRVDALTVDKTSELQDSNGNGVADAGETVRYSFEVVNRGNTELTDVVVVDPMLEDITPGAVDLPAGDRATFTGSYVVTPDDVLAGQLVNTATATATAPGGGGTEVTSPPSTDTLPTQTRGIALTRTAELEDRNGNGMADVGERIVFRYVVTNTGTAPLTGVRVVDDRVAGLEDQVFDLAPGESREVLGEAYVVTEADIRAGEITTEAVAVGTAPDGSTVEAPPLVETVPPAPQRAGVQVTKTADPVSGETVVVGQTISYRVTVVNMGNVTLDEVVLVDDLSDVLDDATVVEIADGLVLDGTDLAWRGALGPDESVELDYVVRVEGGGDGVIANVATALGRGGVGDPDEVEDSDGTEHPVGGVSPGPGIPGPGDPGDPGDPDPSTPGGPGGPDDPSSPGAPGGSDGSDGSDEGDDSGGGWPLPVTGVGSVPQLIGLALLLLLLGLALRHHRGRRAAD